MGTTSTISAEMPKIAINQRKFFSFFLLFIIFAMSPMDSKENCFIFLRLFLKPFSASSLVCSSLISLSRSDCCLSISKEITLPGCSSSRISLILFIGKPISLRKQMILSLFKSSSEYSLLPPSESSDGERIFLVS